VSCHNNIDARPVVLRYRTGDTWSGATTELCLSCGRTTRISSTINAAAFQGIRPGEGQEQPGDLNTFAAILDNSVDVEWGGWSR
jgi:hypothetical protein